MNLDRFHTGPNRNRTGYRRFGEPWARVASEATRQVYAESVECRSSLQGNIMPSVSTANVHSRLAGHANLRGAETAWGAVSFITATHGQQRAGHGWEGSSQQYCHPGLTISVKFHRNCGKFFVSASYREKKFRYFSF